MTRDAYVIVGANLAGGSAALTLRDEGFDGDVVLIGEEPHPPYERPPLSKEYLRGEAPFAKSLLKPRADYEAKGIKLCLGVRASRIDSAQKQVELDGGESLAYDKLLIATGSRNRRLRVPGADLPGVFDLRKVEDADRIRGQAGPGKKAVLAGMGFIGAEVAASLRQSGTEVTAVEMASGPLIHALGLEISKLVEGLHRDHGVELVFEERVARFEGSGKVERVVTDAGRKIDCDFVVVGVGVEPAAELAAGTGVAIENGIVVDEYCRTNVEGIYAAGDVTNHQHPLIQRKVRVEHWQNALRQGAAAARSMIGKPTPYEEVHWFWSDQYDCNIQYAGFHSEWDETVTRGNRDERSFVTFYLKGGRVRSAVAFNQARDLRRSISLIRAGVRADPEKLRDPAVDLRKLVA